MPTAIQNGFLARRIDYRTNGSSLVTNSGSTVSRVVSFTPEPPVLNAIRRRKPADADLVWQGTVYSKTVSSHAYNQVQYSTQNKTGNWYRIYTSSESLVSPLSPYYPAAPYDPMNPLLGKINGDLANLANMLGEYKQTSKMFSDAARRFRKSVNYLRRSLRQAKKRRIGPAIRSARAALSALGAAAEGAAKAAFPPNRAGRPSLSNAWLQWHFGVDTLMKDVYSLAKELQEEVVSLPPRTVKRYSKVSRRVLTDSSFYYNPQKTRVVNVHNAYYERKLIAYVEINNDFLKKVSDHGLTNPVGLLWELTAFSFVVDWFIGIGEWLVALNVPAVLDRSVCYETVRKFSLQRFQFLPSDFLLSGNMLESEDCAVRSRYKVTSRSIRALTAARPRWKPNASVVRVATALALLRQMKS